MKMASNQLEKKDYLKTSLRAYFLQNGFNYGNYQGLGYANVLYPSLRKMYKDDDDKLQEALKENIEFFNTNIHFLPFITSLHLVMLENKTPSSEIRNIKMALMGPLAGIGDTLFHVIPSTIIGSIASYMALEGSPLALVLWIFFGLLRMFCMKNFFSLGYREGAKIVSEIGNRLKKITKAANILGITVIGALIPSVVNARFAYEFSWGEVSISVQELADKIMPSLAPTLVVFFAYWMLGRKKMNSTRVTLLLVVVGILAYNLKVFA